MNGKYDSFMIISTHLTLLSQRKCYVSIYSFLRGLPHLTRMMKRAEPNQGKLLPHVEAEPNFYEMDLRHPLPSSYTPPTDFGAAYPAAPYPNAGHAASWPPSNAPYPYGHYPGHPMNYPPPPYDPYAYPHPHQHLAGQPHHMYPPQGQEHMYGMPPHPYHGHPPYGQPPAGYADPNAYNMYPPNPNLPQHEHPNNYDPYSNIRQEQHPSYDHAQGNGNENAQNEPEYHSHPGY